MAGMLDIRVFMGRINGLGEVLVSATQYSSQTTPSLLSIRFISRNCISNGYKAIKISHSRSNIDARYIEGMDM